MDEFDDILNELGINNNQTSTAEPIVSTNPFHGFMSEEDLNDILTENGLSPVQFDEVEEIEPLALPEVLEETLECNQNDNVEIDTSTLDSLISTPAQQAEPLITPNSPTLLINDATSRFSGAEWFSKIQEQKILIAGIGGIGSNLAFQIARMAPDTLILYDNDTVESVNMSGQLFSRRDVGRTKTDAMVEMINDYTTASTVWGISDLYTENTDPCNVMMCGFDNMEARKTFFNSWFKHINKESTDKSKCLFLDGRLSMDTLQIICLTGDDDINIKRYQEKFLFSDEEAEETICSMKQTTYLACMIGSIMTNIFTNWVAQSLNPNTLYDVPFFIEYNAPYMTFKVEH